MRKDPEILFAATLQDGRIRIVNRRFPPSPDDEGREEPRELLTVERSVTTAALGEPVWHNAVKLIRDTEPVTEYGKYASSPSSRARMDLELLIYDLAYAFIKERTEKEQIKARLFDKLAEWFKANHPLFGYNIASKIEELATKL